MIKTEIHKTNRLTLEAIERMENNEEPTGEDWGLFRKIYFSRWPFISRKKQVLFDYLYEHLMSHKSHEMNEEEAFTDKLMFRDALARDARDRMLKPFILSFACVVCLAALTTAFYFLGY